MADRASPCSAEKRHLRSTSSDRIHHAPRMHCMLTATEQPHHSVSLSNRCSTAAAGRTALVVCNKGAKLLYVPLCWPSSLFTPFFPLSIANPSFQQGSGEPRRLPVERFAPGSWRFLSQLSLLVIPFRIRAVDLVCLLCFPYPLLYQGTWTRSLQMLLGRRWAVLGAGASVPATSPPCFRQFGGFPWLQKQHLMAPSAPLPPGRLWTLEPHLPVVSLPLRKGRSLAPGTFLPP